MLQGLSLRHRHIWVKFLFTDVRGPQRCINEETSALCPVLLIIINEAPHPLLLLRILDNLIDLTLLQLIFLLAQLQLIIFIIFLANISDPFFSIQILFQLFLFLLLQLLKLEHLLDIDTVLSLIRIPHHLIVFVLLCLEFLIAFLYQ